MSYFEHFPAIKYSNPDTGQSDIVTNIIKRVGIKKSVEDNLVSYWEQYNDGKDRPEVLSYRLFDDPSVHWITMILNSVIDPYYDWVLSDQNFDAMINEKYPNNYRIIEVTPDINLADDDSLESFMMLPVIQGEIDFDKVYSSDQKYHAQIIYQGENNDYTTGGYGNFPASGVEKNAIKQINRTDSSYEIITNWDYEVAKNTEKESVVVPDSQYIISLQEELRMLFK